MFLYHGAVVPIDGLPTAAEVERREAQGFALAMAPDGQVVWARPAEADDTAAFARISETLAFLRATLT